jgi:hypothetical protein
VLQRRRVDLRLDRELVDWADGYAKQRGVPTAEVVSAAIRAFREDAERSVPDLEKPKPPLTASRYPNVPGVKRGSDVLADRQRALNKKIQGWS